MSILKLLKLIPTHNLHTYTTQGVNRVQTDKNVQ